MEKDNDLFCSSSSEWDESEHPRDEKGKFVATSEFRYLENSPNPKMRHPTHLYAKSDSHAKYIQLTHSEQIKDYPEANREMDKNPNPKDKRKAYFVPESKTEELGRFGKTKKKWKLSKEDDKRMRPYRDKPFNE